MCKVLITRDNFEFDASVREEHVLMVPSILAEFRAVRRAIKIG